MHKKVVVCVSAVLFALLAVVVVVVADLHDRGFPEQLDVKSSVTLDFSASGLSDEEAFGAMGRVSDESGLGLVKVAPERSGDQSGQVFVVLGTQQRLPDRIERFGDQPAAPVEGPAALANSFASGQYLVTGRSDAVPPFQRWLTEQRVVGDWSHDTLGATLSLVLRQSSFAVALLSATALMVSLVLYWLSVKARGRALRVLGGVPTSRIQYEDLVGFLLVMVSTAVVCDAVALLYVATAHGWAFVPYYATTLLTFNAVVIGATMTGALLMSVSSWPSAEALAAREPPVRSLRRASTVLKAVTFTALLVVAAPAWAAYADARTSAAQQAQWKRLADQVAVTFPASLGESGFQRLKAGVGEVVSDAERADTVALSYAWSGENVDGVDLGAHDQLALVNQRWLDLMTSTAAEGSGGGTPSASTLEQVPVEDVPAQIRQFLEPNLELWLRDRSEPGDPLRHFSFYRSTADAAVPVAVGGNGDLAFAERPLLMVAPDLSRTLDDDFLASAASTGNLVFTGLGPTQAMLAQRGLHDELTVKLVAEEGILRAQVTAYFAWLQGVSIVALFMALAVSASLGAFITAVLRARRDFPLRLAGKRWSDILGERVASEWAAGLALAALVVLLRGADGAALIGVVAVAALLVSPLTHLVAAQWAFGRVTARRL